MMSPDDAAECGGDAAPESEGEPERARDHLLLDVMLGKLATYLRMCGYDAAYAWTGTWRRTTAFWVSPAPRGGRC